MIGLFLGEYNRNFKANLFYLAHQIKTGKEKLIYGRGFPDMNFQISTANKDIKKEFEGALSTTIYTHYNFCEVYGKSPDIDIYSSNDFYYLTYFAFFIQTR